MRGNRDETCLGCGNAGFLQGPISGTAEAGFVGHDGIEIRWFRFGFSVVAGVGTVAFPGFVCPVP